MIHENDFKAYFKLNAPVLRIYGFSALRLKNKELRGRNKSISFRMERM